MRTIGYTVTAVFVILFLLFFSLDGKREDRSEELAFSEELKQYEGYPSAVFAGGCFWGVEFYLEQQTGVIAAVSGYTGGTIENPTYDQVSRGTSGHVEAVIVYYDPELTDYRTLAKHFFEIHDPEQTDGQGPDIGSQYLSVIYYADNQEQRIARELIGILTSEGYDVATSVRERKPFYPAEAYHQDYYQTKRTLPYCHAYTPRFPQESP